VKHLEALVELLDPDTERAELMGVVQMLVTTPVTTGQILPDDTARAAFTRLPQLVDKRPAEFGP
jgi:hypothetical protein